MDKIPNSSFNSFPVYNPNSSVLQSPHEIESLISKLQKTTLQTPSPQAPLPPAAGNQCFNSTRPPVYPLPPQLKQAVTDYLEQVHGGGLEYFDSPMLQNYLEKVIQEALRQVTQARTPPPSTYHPGRADEA